MNGLCWEKYFAPQLWGNGLVAWDARFTLKEIWYKRKTNPFDSFHNFEEVKKALLNFGALFQWVVGHLSEKMLQWCNVYIRGRANLPFPVRLKPQKWLYLANTFLAPPPRGVAALVSVSDDKIQITILILRRGALSKSFISSQGSEMSSDINGKHIQRILGEEGQWLTEVLLFNGILQLRASGSV